VTAIRWLAALVCLALAAVAGAGPAMAAGPDRCLAVAEAPAPRLVQKAAGRLAQAGTGEVRLTFLGHATFLIESAAGVRIATDYNDYVRPSPAPDIVTMNRAHNTHFTDFPDPAIKHVLRGWSPDGGPAAHDVTLRDVRVRNINTNIRSWDGGTLENGNSIFVFELAGLCIAHLGHLHHTLTLQQLALIGQMDVALVPVDGSYTLDVEGMVEVLKALKAPLMIPMHYFSAATLHRFLERVRGTFEIKESAVPTLLLSRDKLPRQPEIFILPGR